MTAASPVRLWVAADKNGNGCCWHAAGTFLRLMQKAAAVVSVLLLAGACGLPRDPRHTLENVRAEHVLRVGVTDDPPFIVRTGDEANGLDAALIRGFAAQLGARVEWVWTAQEEQFQALHRCQLDLMAGGFDEKTPWKKQVALTRPFAEIREAIGAPPLATVPDDLLGHEVAVREGDPAGEMLEKQKATIKSMRELGRGQGLVAAPRAELLRLGYVPQKTLMTRKLVFAVPQGENAFLRRLELYLAAHHAEFAHQAGEPE